MVYRQEECLLMADRAHLGEPSKKIYGIIWEFFPTWGGGDLLNPKTFVILTIALKTPLKHLKTP